MATMKVLIADESKLVLAELREELGKELRIVAAVANAEEAVCAVLRLDPDVLVPDIAMPVPNGIQASMRLRERHPRAKILFLSGSNNQSTFVPPSIHWGRPAPREMEQLCR